MSINLLDLKTIEMIYFIIFVLLIWVWIIAELINSPHIDNNGNIIKKKNDSAVKPNDTNSKGI
jgi:hypothetical protein